MSNEHGYFTECEELRLRIGQVVRWQGLQVGQVCRVRPTVLGLRAPAPEFQVELLRNGQVCRMFCGTENYIMGAIAPCAVR